MDYLAGIYYSFNCTNMHIYTSILLILKPKLPIRVFASDNSTVFAMSSNISLTGVPISVQGTKVA